MAEDARIKRRIESAQGLVHSAISTLYVHSVVCFVLMFVLVAGGPSPLASALSVALTAPRLR
jgi:hypothetical protein